MESLYMFQNLTERLNTTIRNLRGIGRLTPENMQETLRDVRTALLEADVALPVAREFIEKVKEQALGQDVLKSLTPGQALIKVVNDELVAMMSAEHQELQLNTTPPAVILMAGLQGSGKTTSTAKLARWLQENQKKSVMVVSTDIYRPAAIKQLEMLATSTDTHFFPSHTHQKPVDIARDAIKAAKLQFIDVVIIDTAGRLHIDDAMMEEIKALHAAVNPIETLFVVDSMTGQDAANTAKVFGDALPLTGVVLTKVDGDARGGAALSIRAITGKPIKFMGMGEKTQALSVFHPDRIASRILDMGDIVSLVEEAEKHIDRDKVEKLTNKLKKGKGFDLEDFLAQLDQMDSMGGIAKLMDKLPGMGNLPANMKSKIDDNVFKKKKAIIRSMTPKERRHVDLIKSSHKRRIAAGSGTSIQEVNRLLKEFTQLQHTMKKFSKGGMSNMLRQMKGKMPPGLLPPM
jgi:signal recognition particle subunit SRP54